MPTKQETLDVVARHLLTQREPSTAGVDNRCRYRGDNGLKCAVGVLIPDDLYKPEMEGHDANHQVVADALIALGHDVMLCLLLQKVHDNHAVADWPDQLRSLAEDEGLSTARWWTRRKVVRREHDRA